MYLQEIGTDAGIIWTLLAKHQGRLTIREIADQTDFNEGFLLMAIGWLARENKVSFHEENKAIFAQLNNCTSEMYF